MKNNASLFLLNRVLEVVEKLNLHPLLHLQKKCNFVEKNSDESFSCPVVLQVAQLAVHYLSNVQQTNENFNLISAKAAEEIVDHLGDVWCAAHEFAREFSEFSLFKKTKVHEEANDETPQWADDVDERVNFGMATPLRREINVIDVGSGAGFPVVPLAIVFKEVKFTAVESNQKKAKFLLQLQKQLELPNFFVHCGNVKEFFPNFKANFITSRAFASVQKTMKNCSHLLHSEGKLLLFKGKNETIKQELVVANSLLKKKSVRPILLNHPFLPHERHLLCIAPIPKVK